MEYFFKLLNIFRRMQLCAGILKATVGLW